METEEIGSGLNRVPPQEIDAERAVLGGLMLTGENEEALAVAFQIVAAGCFYVTKHQHIFTACETIFGRGDPVDLLTVTKQLEIDGNMTHGLDVPYLNELIDSCPSSANTEHYCHIVRDARIKRYMIQVGTRIQNNAFDDTMEATELMEQSEADVMKVREANFKDTMVELSGAVKDALNHIEKLYNTKENTIGIPTGFTRLDRITSGFQEGQYIIIAGRPGMGKSAIIQNIIRHTAVEHGGAVVLFTLEASTKAFTARLLAQQSGIDSQQLRSGFIGESSWIGLVHAASDLSKALLWIDDKVGIGVSEMRSKLRQVQRKGEIDLIVVDYLQLMQADNPKKSQNRQEEITSISAGLKGLAREFKCPLIACSQLSRECEKRENKRPLLSDLRESGCLAGTTKILLYDTGRYVQIKDLDNSQLHRVGMLNLSTLKLDEGLSLKVIDNGVQQVFTLRTQLGREIKATGTHKFLTISGWKPLDTISHEDRIAIPRTLDLDLPTEKSEAYMGLLAHLIADGCVLKSHSIQYTSGSKELSTIVANYAQEIFGKDIKPRINKERNWYQTYLASAKPLSRKTRNPVSVWFDQLGIFNRRSHEKCVPDIVFASSTKTICQFLKHLWACDGTISISSKNNTWIVYNTSSIQLARAVQSLLLRIGICARLTTVVQHGGKHRDGYHIIISGKPDILTFLDRIGCLKHNHAQAEPKIREYLYSIEENTNRDIIPKVVWRTHVKPSLRQNSITVHNLYHKMGCTSSRTSLNQCNMSRKHARRVADIIQSDDLRKLAVSDIYWDKVVEVKAAGYEQVYDLTVFPEHNFVANDIIVHNSLEQDSDLVLFLYRDSYYDKSAAEETAELIIGKHKDGPVGMIRLNFDPKILTFTEA